MARSYLIRKEEYQQEGRKKAQENNILHAIGCMLYWGEGAKNRWSVRISNSNLYLLRIFVKFLKECYNVQKEEIVIRIHCYDSENVKKIETFWMKNLGLPAECLRKTIVNNVSKYSKRKRGNTIPHGTCHLAVYSTKILQSILGAIQEYGHCKMDWSDSRS